MEDYFSNITSLTVTADILWPLLSLVILLLLSALLSGSEVAFFSLNHNDIIALKKSDDSVSQKSVSMLSKQNELLATILIANNLVNIAAVIVANNTINRLISFGNAHTAEFIVKTIIVTFLLLLFGEIMPKILASSSPMRFVRIVSKPIYILKQIFRPLSYILISSSSHINEVIAKRKANISMNELSEALDIATADGTEDKRILTGIVRFVNTEIASIMKHRVDVIAIDLESNFEQVRSTIINSGFSRLPVYEEELDNIRGVLYVKDLLPHLGKEEFAWQNIIRKPFFVPTHKKINDLLEEFQTQQIHFAIVVDEYGSTQGIVSLEDILEEIVGEISDESDLDENLYTKIDNNTFVFDGKTHIADFLRVFEEQDDVLDQYKGESETIAGLMLESKRDFLKLGDKITVGGFEFKVEGVEGRRISKIKITRS